MPKHVLTAASPVASDHVWYRNVVDATGPGWEVREAWERAYERLRPALDSDFLIKFRRQTPDHVSELMFGAALLNAGWSLAPRTTGFDFTFTRAGEPERLLVEVVTPEPPSSDAWEETPIMGGKGIFYSYDQSSRDAAMLRLTSAFCRKADLIKSAVQDGRAKKTDYRVIAISGVRINKEMGLYLSACGALPDYAAAFLPIGPLTVPITVPRDFSEPPKFGEAHYVYSGQIPKPGKTPVERRAFLCDAFRHVDAVIFSSLITGGSDAPEIDMSTLHNPFSDHTSPVLLGLGADYTVSVSDEEFGVTLAASETEIDFRSRPTRRGP